MFSRLFLEKEEDIDIKIRSVSNWKFRFQSQNFCFKLIFCVSKRFFVVKISENNQFCRSTGSDDKCRLHRKWCRRHFCFLSAAIIGGENIYRNVRSKPERIHENWLFSKTRIFAPTVLHRRIVVARCSIHSHLQLLALGGFAAQKTTLSCF